MRKVLVLLIALLACIGCVRNRMSSWNSEDSRIIADEAVVELLAGEWLADHTAMHSSLPVLSVGQIQNLSADTVDMEPIREGLTRHLLQSRRVRMIVPRNGFAVPEDSLVAQYYRQLALDGGAEYFLQGSLKSHADKKLRTWVLDLELVEPASGDIFLLVQLQKQKPLKVPRTEAG